MSHWSSIHSLVIRLNCSAESSCTVLYMLKAYTWLTHESSEHDCIFKRSELLNLVEMAILTNPKPTIYRPCEVTGVWHNFWKSCRPYSCFSGQVYKEQMLNWCGLTIKNTFILSTLIKGLNQAKISLKSVILFWLLNMTIWCKHVHK